MRWFVVFALPIVAAWLLGWTLIWIDERKESESR